MTRQNSPSVHMLMSLQAAGPVSSFIDPLDELLLVDAGLALLAHQEILAGLQAVTRVRALASDAAARGLSGLAGQLGVELIDDQGWIQLTVSADRVLSWK